MKLSSKFAFHCIVSFCIGVGFWNIFFNNEKNQCEMTFMFEHPNFKEVFLDMIKYNIYCVRKMVCYKFQGPQHVLVLSF